MLYRTCYTGHVLPILCLIRGTGVTGRLGMLSHAENAWDPQALHACVDLYLLQHSSAILYIYIWSFVLFSHDIEGDSIVLVKWR